MGRGRHHVVETPPSGELVAQDRFAGGHLLVVRRRRARVAAPKPSVVAGRACEAAVALASLDRTANGLRAYFMPEDEKSTLYIYEAEVK